MTLEEQPCGRSACEKAGCSHLTPLSCVLSISAFSFSYSNQKAHGAEEPSQPVASLGRCAPFLFSAWERAGSLQHLDLEWVIKPKRRSRRAKISSFLPPHTPYSACSQAFRFLCFREVLKSLPQQPLRMRAHSSRAKSQMQSSWQSAEVQRRKIIFPIPEIISTRQKFSRLHEDELGRRFCLWALFLCLFCLSKRTGRCDQS